MFSSIIYLDVGCKEHLSWLVKILYYCIHCHAHIFSKREWEGGEREMYKGMEREAEKGNFHFTERIYALLIV